MRTAKRFTPAVLDRFLREGRGTGIYTEYIPWHRVSRGDPSSRGRSHLLNWRGRQRELLSDGELVLTLFATMLPNINDLREQFPLSLETGGHELCDYYPGALKEGFPGTKEIANKLEYRHPTTRGNGETAPWVMTTDLLLALEQPDKRLSLLAVAYKTQEDLEKSRTKQLLEIEQAYWAARNVQWILITPEQYDKRVGLTLQRVEPWALGAPASEKTRELVVDTFYNQPDQSQTALLNRVCAAIGGDMDLAQRALWQAVCTRRLPIDLTLGWRPHLPLKHLTPAAFLAQNPIAMRRSAWN